ncbi:class I SAM-dependent methyltransferase [Streptosporangium amethystogenes]|uniref:class I SAM-dependent methyltransferase n=1 Tax=Streptosporangium amethystogenes TaxID=2002 RepID=UPI0037AD1F09
MRPSFAEALPYADGEFDTVLSCVGVMFVPNHQAGANELIRVCRPGGTIGLLSWTPEGFIGQMFAAIQHASTTDEENRQRKPGCVHSAPGGG